MRNKLISLIAFFIFIAICGGYLVQRNNKKELILKNQFCAWEILGSIRDEQTKHSKTLGEFLDFDKLAHVTKNKLIKNLIKSSENGVVARHGYYFYIYLLSGKKNIYPFGKRNDTLKNKNFLCYAWPIKIGKTGIQAYVIDHTGSLNVCNNNIQRYSGVKKPSIKACFRKKELIYNDREFWFTSSDGWYNHYQLKKQKRFVCD
ncbi:DUF2950 family protein [Candidatus Uabimicrobium helgolandensis]